MSVVVISVICTEWSPSRSSVYSIMMKVLGEENGIRAADVQMKVLPNQVFLFDRKQEKGNPKK